MNNSFLNFSEIENNSENSEITNSCFLENEEIKGDKKFEKRFEEVFKSDFNLTNLEKYNINGNLFDEKKSQYYNSTQIFSNLENAKIDKSDKNYNLIGKKTEIKKKKFKINKINDKREITFITFNSKFNKYLTEKINKIISENCQFSQFYFTDENPLLSTKFTQCGIQKKLKTYLSTSIKEFIKQENLEKISGIGLQKYYLFNSPIFELMIEYYEYIYGHKNEFNKYLLDKKFVIRNKKFSKEGLINLNYEENSKKVYGYLDFFKIEINKQKKEGKKKRRFSIYSKE